MGRLRDTLAVRLAGGTIRLAVAIVTVILFGIGVPFGWVWVGSQLQGGTAPSLSGLGVTLVGIIGSYTALAVVFAWIKDFGRDPEERDRPVRHDWNRSLSSERRGPTETTGIEDIAMAATILVGIICTIWFLLFGDPGTPVGQG